MWKTLGLVLGIQWCSINSDVLPTRKGGLIDSSPPLSCVFFIYIYNFIYLSLAVLGLGCCEAFSLVAVSGGHPSLRGTGFSSQWLFLLRSTDSRRTTSVVAKSHGLSCSAACGIFLDQNLCPLHWRADSSPLRHQGSPHCVS